MGSFYKKMSVAGCLILSVFGCNTIRIQGEKVAYKDICGDCNPGNHGPYMIMKNKTYDPQLDDISSPKAIAHEILGYVFPENIMTASIKIPCAKNSVINPFPLEVIKPLGTTDGTNIDYNVKELLSLNVSAAVETDLANIKTANPTLPLSSLEQFKAKLTAAYAKFANKELKIRGKYFQYGLDDEVVIEIAKRINYSDCSDYMHTVTSEGSKRIITAIGMVYFDIESSENTVDEIASQLQADAKSYGITYSINTEFKKNISKSLKKTTPNYYQIITWRTVGVEELKDLQ